MNKKLIIFSILILLLIAGGAFWWRSGKKEAKEAQSVSVDKYQSCVEECGEKFGAVGLPARMKCNSECEKKYLK